MLLSVQIFLFCSTNTISIRAVLSSVFGWMALHNTPTPGLTMTGLTSLIWRMVSSQSDLFRFLFHNIYTGAVCIGVACSVKVSNWFNFFSRVVMFGIPVHWILGLEKDFGIRASIQTCDFCQSSWPGHVLPSCCWRVWSGVTLVVGFFSHPG